MQRTHDNSRRSAATAGTTTTTTSTSAPQVVDPGQLAQTPDRPTGASAGLKSRVRALWQAITTGDPAVAVPFFFPASAYTQVKAISDPISDWQHRLVAAYQRDIQALHSTIAMTAPQLQDILGDV